MPTHPLNSTLLPSGATTGASGNDALLRVATYNIHKGVRGVGPGKRLEIHNLAEGIEALDADLVFLQEVRSRHDLEARRFARSSFGWPAQPQADFLAPEGYGVAYRTNAYTRGGGEHGNALLSRWPIGADIWHHDVSDHRFEQRGLLHVPVHWMDVHLHAIVAHFGLIHASRVRQVERLAQYIADHVPDGAPLIVAGDFNDWGERLDGLMREAGLERALGAEGRRALTFPSRVPVFALDRVYLRGLRCRSTFVPRGTTWARMSDHLPLVAELERVR
ncbi:MAG: endonuclease/exonuclease/phosphatase family protein [Pseudomonadota bacterium]|uniref:Endonuclease/exonuclease/phosphatase family protein n=1 Tax=Caldimonas aquatica TaxID=376175 RepID=A0ABY6MUJ8_9BURK|nr:endonuclease/exonuclease/phosphatase family protein [Schlegelella aquatica]UZD55682.1 endonuclease/exonuclease/phosphatase family protein [Schlegelella aquatica]